LSTVKRTAERTAMSKPTEFELTQEEEGGALLHEVGSAGPVTIPPWVVGRKFALTAVMCTACAAAAALALLSGQPGTHVDFTPPKPHQLYSEYGAQAQAELETDQFGRSMLSKARQPVAPIEPPSNAEQLPWGEANTNDGHLSDSRAAKLLGKTLRATIDVSQVGCGCVAGFFLYEGDQDPYCDASGSWPGQVERCGEIDLFEGNKFGWHSTLHNKMDHPGQQGGFGGMQQQDMMYGTGPRDMTGDEYGPGGSIIDTEQPFHVAISFPQGPDGSLVDMIVMLYQDGKDTAVEWRVNKKREREGLDCSRTDCDNCFSKPGCEYGQEDLRSFADMLSNGMTVQSTWWGCDEPWLDGTLDDEEGGCKINPGQEGQESYGTYRGAHNECDGKWYKVDGWTLEDVQDLAQDWYSILQDMDAQPVLPRFSSGSKSVRVVNPSMGAPSTEQGSEAMTSMFKSADADGSGSLSYGEFARFADEHQIAD